jgi:4-hydroxy-tetrahydrodipicolinate reductase
VIRVAVAGAAGRMGATVCRAVEEAGDLELVARADPALGVDLAEALREHRPEVVVDFTVPGTALANARTCVAAGVHVVIGTTGFDLAALEALPDPSDGGANVFVAPNFAIGAVLMMQFAAQAARHLASAEIIELHHAGKLDKPSGTAARTATLMEAARREGSGADAAGPDRSAADAVAGRDVSAETSAAIPIHSVRLPGLVAHQEVIFGGTGETLTIRHDSIDRESFMPGVLLAVRRVGSLERTPVVGLEHLLGLV